jgi:flagellar basal body-associated protein FliL
MVRITVLLQEAAQRGADPQVINIAIWVLVLIILGALLYAVVYLARQNKDEKEHAPPAKKKPSVGSEEPRTPEL